MKNNYLIEKKTPNDQKLETKTKQIQKWNE